MNESVSRAGRQDIGVSEAPAEITMEEGEWEQVKTQDKIKSITVPDRSSVGFN